VEIVTVADAPTPVDTVTLPVPCPTMPAPLWAVALMAQVPVGTDEMVTLGPEETNGPRVWVPLVRTTLYEVTAVVQSATKVREVPPEKAIVTVPGLALTTETPPTGLWQLRTSTGRRRTHGLRRNFILLLLILGPTP
jgi:hypothetical protein